MLCVAIILVLLAGAGEAQTEHHSAMLNHSVATQLSVEISADQFSIAADNVTIAELITEIARHSGLRLDLHGPLDERISIELHQLPLPVVLNRILRSHNFALQYRSSSNEDHPDKTHAGKLWVFSKDSGSGFPPMSPTTSDLEQTVASLSITLSGDDAYASLQAISTLTDIGGDSAAMALAAALHNADAAVREEGAYALGEVGGEIAIQLLEQTLIDQKPAVREAAIAALTDIGGEQSTHILATALHDPETSLRREALYALGEIGNKTAIGLLQQALQDQQISVRETASEILAELSNQE